MILCHIKTFTFVHCLTPFFLYEQKSVLHIHIIFFIDTFILRSHTLIHNATSMPYSHTSWQANFRNSTLTQDWFSALTFLSTVLKQFATKLHSRLPALFCTGSPQPTVLSPIRFTLYAHPTPIVKYSEDSAMEDLSNSNSVYFAEVERFNNWCRDNSLGLNVKKTKEMLPPSFQVSLLMSWKLKEWLSTNI